MLLLAAQARRVAEGVAGSCCLCAGPIAVKAAVWVCVEHIHKHKLGFTYEGPVQGTAAVSASTRPVPQKCRPRRAGASVALCAVLCCAVV